LRSVSDVKGEDNIGELAVRGVRVILQVYIEADIEICVGLIGQSEDALSGCEAREKAGQKRGPRDLPQALHFNCDSNSLQALSVL
jgi:hypothetical protein